MERSSVDSLLRTSQAYCQQVCEKETLNHGIAFYGTRFPAVATANQYREAWVTDRVHISPAFEEAERWFGDHGLRCLRWATAGGQPSDELTSFLQGHGFIPHHYLAMVLSEWPEFKTDGTVRILPARAMRAAFRAMLAWTSAHHGATEQEQAQSIEAMEDRLDDPSYDMFVALGEHGPAGHAALYQVGDVARVMDLEIMDDATGERVAPHLLVHVLALARRLAIRNVLVQAPAEDKARRALLERAGFIMGGTFTEFERAPT